MKTTTIASLLHGNRIRNTAAQICLWIVLIVSLLIFSIPFLFMISNSFEEFSYVLPYPPRLIPSRLNFAAYSYIISRSDFLPALKNSIINTFGTIGFALLISTISAYGFAKIKFKGRELLFKLYIFTLMMPGFLNIIPQFIVLKGIHLPFYGDGLVGTRLGLMLIYISTGICGNTFFLRGFFRSLPDALIESVILDGGGHGTIFFRIMLPLSAPSVGTLAIFSIQGMWEEYFTAKVLVGANEAMITLPLLLQRLNGQHSTRWEWVFACSLIALIPIVALFIIFQKKMVVGGLTQGSVKG